MLASDSLFLTHKHHKDVKGLSGKKCALRNMQYFLFQPCDLEQCVIYFAVLTGVSLETLVHNDYKGPFRVCKAM